MKLNGKVLSVSLAVLVFGVANALRGGFGVALTLPPADAKGAVLAVQPIGCHGPGASVAAYAEGLVDGARKTIPLKLAPMAGQADKYLVSRQWPAQGSWVLIFTAKKDGMAVHAMVKMEDGKVPMVDKPKGEFWTRTKTLPDGKTQLRPWTFVDAPKVVATYIVSGDLKAAVHYALTSASMK